MDVSKVKAAVENVRVELLKVRDAAISVASAKGANGDAIRQLNGIQSLGKADAMLDKVIDRIEDAVERAAPPVKKEKKAKDVAPAAHAAKK
jgi:hypothetical protein